MSGAIIAQGKEFEKAPAGNHVAICYEMIHIGTIMENFQGRPRLRNVVRIGWELCNVKAKDALPSDPPMTYSQDFTLLLSSKSAMGSMLSSWRGKTFTPDELKGFDITKVVGAPCLLNIIHTAHQTEPGRLVVKIASVSRLPEGFTAPALRHPKVVLSYLAWDEVLFASLPGFLQDKIMKSSEWTEMNNKRLGLTPAVSFQDPNSITQPLDDLPF